MCCEEQVELKVIQYTQVLSSRYTFGDFHYIFCLNFYQFLLWTGCEAGADGAQGRPEHSMASIFSGSEKLPDKRAKY